MYKLIYTLNATNTTIQEAQELLQEIKQGTLCLAKHMTTTIEYAKRNFTPQSMQKNSTNTIHNETERLYQTQQEQKIKIFDKIDRYFTKIHTPTKHDSRDNDSRDKHNLDKRQQ